VGRLGLDEVEEILREHAPGTRETLLVEELGDRRAVVRLHEAGTQLRPGATVSGPSQFALADFAMWVILLGLRGRDAVHAVTSNLAMDFLRRPAATDLVATAELLKLGRRLAMGTVVLRSDGDDRPVSHASVTYAMP
jgi:acyl-coenzyme A thioesterase PaaI-like protein